MAEKEIRSGMPNEDLQHQIEFIINNQAQFSAGIQQLKDLHLQAETRMTKLEDVCLRLGNSLVNLTDRVAEIAVAQTHVDTKMADLAKSQEQLAESQEHTDQRLSALIDIVMTDRNGKGST
jgi:septal ring factor EnvC (AmiA/AmiB activator)